MVTFRLSENPRKIPARLEQSLTNEAKQTRVERSLFDQQGIAGDLPDAQKDAVAMQVGRARPPSG